MIKSLLSKIFYATTIIRLLNKHLTCEATGLKFSLLEALENSLDFEGVSNISIKEKEDASNKLSEVLGKEFENYSSAIIEKFPTIALLFLIWSRYGYVNTTLTNYLVAFYLANSKSEAEHFAALYCWAYLEETINNAIPSKDRFVVQVLEIKESDLIKLKISNGNYGWEFDNPKAMPYIVSEISQKFFGLS